jgi:hypothetical protein
MHILITVGKEQKLLRGEPRNFELCSQINRRDIETGKINQEWVAEKWFSTLEGVFHSLLNMKLKASNATSIMELKEDLVRFRKELMDYYNTGF